MAITPPGQADITRVMTRTIRALGLTDPNSPDSDTVIPGSPFTRNNIRDAVLQADNDYCLIILDDPFHPFKTIFFTEEPDALLSGEMIPEHLGSHSKVLIETATDIFSQGRLARNYDHVRKTEQFPELYGNPKDLYWIENGVIWHTGKSAKVYAATYNPDRTSNGGDGALQSPESYENGIMAGAVGSLYMSGQDLGHRSFYLQQDREFQAMARRRVTSMPEPEIYQRAAA